MPALSFIHDVRDKFLRLTQREQLLVVGVVVAALYFSFDALVFANQKAREQLLVEKQKAAQAQVLVLSTQIAAVERTRAEEIDQKTRELNQLKAQAEVVEQMVRSVSDQLPPIKALVGAIVDAGDATGVDLVSVKTLPVKSVQGLIAGSASAAKPGPAAMLYKHGVELVLRGSYLDLLASLQTLEERYPKLLWSEAVLAAETYPQNTLRVTAFMLSTQPKP